MVEAPMYFPTTADWQDPLAFISSIRHEASKYGMCRIRLPVTASQPVGKVLGTTTFKFRARMQEVRRSKRSGGAGGSWSDGDSYFDPQTYTIPKQL
ncbi:hypothetical protein FOA52_010707 [Chlamydomonas sp. UWO 241]|nr:hypothetical protein FOA52_010707 [Chlamydomonas sp. UWO 241]